MVAAMIAQGSDSFTGARRCIVLLLQICGGALMVDSNSR